MSTSYPWLVSETGTVVIHDELKKKEKWRTGVESERTNVMRHKREEEQRKNEKKSCERGEAEEDGGGMILPLPYLISRENAQLTFRTKKRRQRKCVGTNTRESRMLCASAIAASTNRQRRGDRGN